MNIIYTSMDNYAPYLGISMISLFENNRHTKINVFILSNDICEKNKKKLLQIGNDYGQNVIILSANEVGDKFDFEVDTYGFGLAALIRLFSASYLPDDIDKALYIDCDTIVAENLQELWETDIEDYYLAAVIDFAMPRSRVEEIGLPSDAMYYNAGVLLMNLKKWRKDNLEKIFLDYYKSKSGKLQYADQDVINYCCYDMIKTISVKYNFPPNLKAYPPSYIVKNRVGYMDMKVEELKSIIKSPSIIHFMGDERPWVKGNHNAYKKYYLKYKDISPWKSLESRKGNVLYMQVYFVLNLLTRVWPQFRTVFFEHIGINKFKWFGKK